MWKVLLIAVGLVCLLPLTAKKKKDETQVLELPKDPPLAVVAASHNLVFHVSPLSAKGLLSAQTRDAVKALMKLDNGAAIVKIRAFVVGTGDMRRVPAIISETLTEKKLPLPAVTVIQAGGLPLEGAQVVLESISVARREVNPAGIVFIAGQTATSEKALQPTLPLAEKSLASLGEGDMLRVTCFTSSLDDAGRIHSMASAKYPHAAVDVVEMQRASPRTTVECEATARAAGGAGLVAAAKLVFTGTQLAFGADDNAARLAYQRLDKALEPLGTSAKHAAMANFYPLSNSIGARARRIGLEFFDTAHPPVTTLLPFEGLPSMDASFGMDVVAAVP
jgi:enamine deaminase RidA (YjgF/YER057c/UK114 family)